MTDTSSFDCGVSADGLHARVRIDATLCAAALEDLIDSLMACRQAMAPRRQPVMFAGMRIRIGDGVHRQEGEDGTLIAVHHPGIGWVGTSSLPR